MASKVGTCTVDNRTKHTQKEKPTFSVVCFQLTHYTSLFNLNSIVASPSLSPSYTSANNPDSLSYWKDFPSCFGYFQCRHCSSTCIPVTSNMRTFLASLLVLLLMVLYPATAFTTKKLDPRSSRPAFKASPSATVSSSSRLS